MTALPPGYESDFTKDLAPAGHISSGEKGTIAKAQGSAGPGSDSGWPDPPEPAAFHGAAGEFVETVAEHSEADPAALLAQYLTAAGNLFGTGCYYQVEGDQHPARLWVMVIGSTSKARKGTSWSRVRQVAAEVDPAWAERITGGLSSGEGPLWAVRDEIYRQVKKTNEDGEDEFVEVLDDPGQADKRLTVLESELSRIFDVIGRSGSTLSETLRRLWDGGTVSNLSKNSSFKATDPHVSVVGHISREELRRKIDDGEVWNGLCNRFILFAARRAQSLPFGGEVKHGDLVLLRRRLGAAVSAAGEHKGRRISWDEPAAARWKEVYEQLSAEQPGMVGAVTARAEAHVVRLAVTYALLDMKTVIGLPHLEAAQAVWEYAQRSAEWAFGDSTGDALADEALQALRAAPGGLGRTELRALFHNNVSSERLSRSLTVLLISGLARPVFEETGGRPRERWEVIT